MLSSTASAPSTHIKLKKRLPSPLHPSGWHGQQLPCAGTHTRLQAHCTHTFMGALSNGRAPLPTQHCCPHTTPFHLPCVSPSCLLFQLHTCTLCTSGLGQRETAPSSQHWAQRLYDSCPFLTPLSLPPHSPQSPPVAGFGTHIVSAPVAGTRRPHSLQ